MKNEKTTGKHHRKTILPQIISLCLLTWLMSLGFVFGQKQGEKKLELVYDQKQAEQTVLVEISPDGKTELVGGTDYITLRDFASGKEKFKTKTSSVIKSVKFSPNSKYLLIVYDDKTLESWDIEKGVKLRSLVGQLNKIVDAAISPDGKTVIVIGLGRETRIWDFETGEEKKSFIRLPNSPEISSVAFSPDGKYVLTANKNKVLRLWNIETEQSEKEYWTEFDIKDTEFSEIASPISKTNLNVGYNTILTAENGGTVRLFDYESKNEIIRLINDSSITSVSSFVKSPNTKANPYWGSIITSDENGLIKIWDLLKPENTANFPVIINFNQNSSHPLIAEVKVLSGHTDRINSVTVTLDKKFLLSNSSDSTTRIWNLEQGKELCKIVSFGNGGWTVINSEGRFDSANNGEVQNLFWKYGNETILLSELKEMYYEPNLLAKLLGYSKEPLRTIVPLKDLKLYPEIVAQNFDEKTGKLNIKLKNRGGGIGRTEVFVNDKRVVEDARDEKLKKNPNIAIDATVDLTVDLPASALVKGVKNEIKVITSNYLKEIGKGNIQSRGTAVFYLDKNKAETELPNLYAIVGGVSDYDGDQLDLNFAAKDAEDFSNALKLGANRLFCPNQTPDCLNKINITTLSTARENPNEQPTKDNFKKAFAEIAKKAKPEDILVVYLSGHGVTLGTGTDTYFYLTKEARSASREDLAKTFQTAAISNAELTDWLTPNDKNPDDIWVNTGKQVIILDTCAAGNFAENDWKKDRDLSGDQIRAMDFLSGKTGTFILMGSAANRPSYEANRFNQGLLTFALLEGMKGRALQPATGNIDVGLLFDYAGNRVPNLAKEMSLDQNPIIKRPSGNPFVFGQMSEEDKSKINLPKLKPMLLRPRFGSGEENDDPLNIVGKLRKCFDSESSYEAMKRSGKGEPLMIYVDDDSFPGAVRVTGTYTIEGENVRVKAFLRQDGKTIANFEVAATKDKIAEEIMNAVRTELAKL